MYLCDSNVWLALALSGHVDHPLALAWLDGIDEVASVLFCRTTQQTFLRLLTNPAMLAPYGNPPLTNNQAWAAYEALLADDRIELRAHEPADLETSWKAFARRDSASPRLWMDAYLAAFAVGEGCRMVTNDAAFRQFEGLELVLIGDTAQESEPQRDTGA